VTAGGFDPVALLEALTRHGVQFVIIGGIAARLLGSPTVTRDLDVCPSRSRKNLEQLAECLRELGARLRGVDDDVPFLLDARTLATGNNFTFATEAGDLDVLALPSGVAGYEALAANASPVDIDGVTVLVVDIDDLIRMKTAAGRPKDRVEVEILAALRDELGR
jgi:hypothetical protein